MSFEEFETDFLLELKKNNKDCIRRIEKNGELIEQHLGENGNPKTIDKFSNEINLIILQSKKFSLIEKVLKHKSFSKVYLSFKNSTILVEACKVGKKDIIKWLLTMDINPCIQDENGNSALMYASENPSLISIVKQLVLYKECLNLVDKNGENALFHSLRNNNALIELLRTDIDINHLNNNYDSVLLYCCKNELYGNIILLMRNDIDVNIIDNNGRTAAMYLAEKGKSTELRTLNLRNCNYDIINQKNESVLSIVINKIYGPERETRAGFYSFYFNIIKMLADYNCDFNIPIDENENTAILILMLADDTITLNYILDNNKNYDLTLKNKFGECPLSLCFKCKTSFYNIFTHFKKNSTINYDYIEQNTNNSLLMLCAMNDSKTLIQEVLENNVNSINHLNNRKENALILATKLQCKNSVNVLLKYGINVNQQDYLGNTALYYAVDLQDPYLVSLIMNHHADINIKNNEGKSIIDYAKELNNKNIINILENPNSSKILSDKTIDNKNMNKSEDENELSCKYTDTLEYLYPWVDYNYKDFVKSKNMKHIQRDYLKRKYESLYYERNIHYATVLPFF